MSTTEDQLPDRVSEIFNGRTLFISGGSGFLGKVLIEKLLRCTNVKRIYILLRPKKGKSPPERLDDIFSNVLFSVLKTEKPETLKKCIAIPGDVSEVDLGISPEDRKRIQEEAEFVFHSAASTRFDDSVRVAVKINTRGTKYMLDLAAQCKKLKVFGHVSTAYAFPKEKILYEEAYPPPANPHDILRKIDFENEEESEETEKLLGDCPNTYTFSKALAEALVVEQFGKLPATIVRPSVVCPIWREPIPGWCNNLQGPMGLFVGGGKGIIRSMYVNSESYADFIPADVCINAMLVGCWTFLTQKNVGNIANIISSSEFNFTWEEIVNMGKDIIYNEIPFNGVVWYPGGTLKNSKFLHTICFYLFQLIPALFIDLLLIIFGYKPILYNIQRRIEKGADVFEYYTTKTWNFSNMKGQETRKLLNAKEKSIYKIDGDGLNVKEYLKQCMMSVRRYNLKEPDDTIPAAKRHMKIMWAVDKICKTLFWLMVIKYLYKWFLAPLLGYDS